MAPRGWGFSTEAKLDILSAYLPAFAMACKRAGELVYLDLFAGNTSNERRDVDRDIKGSSVRALEALPPNAHVFLFELPLVADELGGALREMFPGRQFEVVPGDCNITITDVLGRLVDDDVDWAPTFAFVDPYSSAALRWDTITTLADFKRGRLYDLVFATDNDAGNRIMRDVYAKAAQRFEEMRHEARERRRADLSGQPSLFTPEAIGAMNAQDAPPYEPDRPAPPYSGDRMED